MLPFKIYDNINNIMYRQSHAAMILYQGQVYQSHLPTNLKMCKDVLLGLFGNPKIIAPGVYASLPAFPPYDPVLCIYIM